MTGFTTNSGMLTLLRLLNYFDMTGLAGLATSEVDRPGRDLRDGRSTIVTVTPEAVRYEAAAYRQKDQKSRHENSSEPEEVSCVPKDTHRTTSTFPGGYEPALKRDDAT
jgi:hypothetical protein